PGVVGAPLGRSNGIKIMIIFVASEFRRPYLSDHIIGVFSAGPRREAQMKRVRESTRLIIADDHPLFRGAVREALSRLCEKSDIAEAGNFEEISKLLERGTDVDLILLDLSMPGVRGFSGLMYLRAQYPSVPIIVVSASDDPAVIRRCMDFGASGFIPKTLGIETMRDAIERGFEGVIWPRPAIDLDRGADEEFAKLMARLAPLTP